jgi:hypothetical protein
VRGLPVGLQPMTVQCREAIDWVVLIGCAPFGGMCLSLSFRLVRSLKHLVAAFCIRDTRGVLNVSTSVVDSEGVDLVFHWRGSTATLAEVETSRCQGLQKPRQRSKLIGSWTTNCCADTRVASFSPRYGLAQPSELPVRTGALSPPTRTRAWNPSRGGWFLPLKP